MNDENKYMNLPDDVVSELLRVGEKCLDEVMKSRNRLKDKCQTMLMFLITGVVGIVGFLLGNGLTHEHVPLAVFCGVLAAIAVVLFFRVMARAEEIPYMPPYLNYNDDADSKNTATGMDYRKWELCALDTSIDKIHADMRNTSRMFNRTMVASLLSSVLFMLYLIFNSFI